MLAATTAITDRPTPPALVAQHRDIDPAVIASFSRNRPLVVPV